MSSLVSQSLKESEDKSLTIDRNAEFTSPARAQSFIQPDQTKFAMSPLILNDEQQSESRDQNQKLKSSSNSIVYQLKESLSNVLRLKEQNNIENAKIQSYKQMQEDELANLKCLKKVSQRSDYVTAILLGSKSKSTQKQSALSTKNFRRSQSHDLHGLGGEILSNASHQNMQQNSRGNYFRLIKSLTVKTNAQVHCSGDQTQLDASSEKRGLTQSSSRQQRKSFLLYPEDKSFKVWDVIRTVNLLLVCIIMPFYVAFQNDTDDQAEEDGLFNWDTINMISDFIFGIDIIVVFFSAFYDLEYTIVEDRQQIAIAYLRNWFLIDAIAIFPFEAIIESSQDASKNVNGMVRVTQIGRLYKLVKLTRLIRLLKIFKLQGFQENGIKRLMFFVCVSVLICHISACFWVFQTLFTDEGQTTWLSDDAEMSNQDRYITAFYFIVTTFSTVGFGDISATNSNEKIFCIIIMCLGVTAFAAGTSELTNLISSYDSGNQKLSEQVSLLNKLYKEYHLPIHLYERIKRSIRFQQRNDTDQLVDFLQELPSDLKIEASYYYFENTIRQIKFFKSRSKTFIAWICPLLRPQSHRKEQYVFHENDHVTQIYYLKTGQAGYVLPRHKNMLYLKLEQGVQIGVNCIVASFALKGLIFDLENWVKESQILKHQFVIMTQSDCELLVLKTHDLQLMKNEFYEVYIQAFEKSLTILKRIIKEKLKAIQFSNSLMQGYFNKTLQNDEIEHKVSRNVRKLNQIEPDELRKFDTMCFTELDQQMSEDSELSVSANSDEKSNNNHQTMSNKDMEWQIFNDSETATPIFKLQTDQEKLVQQQFVKYATFMSKSNDANQRNSKSNELNGRNSKEFQKGSQSFRQKSFDSFCHRIEEQMQLYQNDINQRMKTLEQVFDLQKESNPCPNIRTQSFSKSSGLEPYSQNEQIDHKLRDQQSHMNQQHQMQIMYEQLQVQSAQISNVERMLSGVLQQRNNKFKEESE